VEHIPHDSEKTGAHRSRPGRPELPCFVAPTDFQLRRLVDAKIQPHLMEEFGPAFWETPWETGHGWFFRPWNQPPIWENVFDFRISEDMHANFFWCSKLYISVQKDVVSTNHQGDFKPTKPKLRWFDQEQCQSCFKPDLATGPPTISRTNNNGFHKHC